MVPAPPARPAALRRQPAHPAGGPRRLLRRPLHPRTGEPAGSERPHRQSVRPRRGAARNRLLRPGEPLVIVSTRFGDREVETRAAGEWGSEHLIPSPDGYGALPPEHASSLPAVGDAIRLISGTLASMTLAVFAGVDAKKKKRDDSWQ